MERILLVDDEKGILNALNRLLFESDYRIFTAQNGIEALEILRKESIDFIISDMKMPKMNGYQLLQEVKKEYPNTIRIILSGYAEKELIMKSVEENLALTYLLKPWDNHQLLILIQKLFSIKKTLEKKNLLNLIFNETGFLVKSKSCCFHLKEKIEKCKDIMVLKEDFEKDPILATKVLYFVNTAFTAKTASVEKALSFLDKETLKKILLAENNNVFTTDGTYQELIHHSQLTNQLFNQLYPKLMDDEKVPDEYKVIGLLANIGAIVMESALKEEFGLIKSTSVENIAQIPELEDSILGYNHQEVAGYLLSWWGFPYPVVEVGMYHHQPLDNKVVNKNLLALVHISSYYAWKLMDKEPSIKVIEDSLRYLNLNKEKMEEWLTVINDNLHYPKE